MLRSDSRIIETGGNRIDLIDLTVFILTEIRFHSMKDTDAARGHRSCVHPCLHAFSRRFTADESYVFIADKGIKTSHSIAAAAHTGHYRRRQTSFFFENLLSRLPADYALKVPHDHGKRMRSHDGSQDIESIVHPV